MECWNWNEIAEEKLNPLVTRKIIHTSGMTIIQLKFKKGAVVPLHNHVHQQVTQVASGALRVEVAGEQIMLRAGDVLSIPSDAPHLTEALEDTTSVDIFTPAREDLLSR